MLPSEAVAALKGQTTHALLPGGLQRCATRTKEALPCVPQRDGALPACGAACGEVTKEVRIVCGFEMFARGHEEQLLARHPHASFQQVLQVAQLHVYSRWTDGQMDRWLDRYMLLLLPSIDRCMLPSRSL